MVEHLFITRHLIEKYGRDSAVVKDMGNVCAVIPGVMSQTGMETAEILHGLVREIKPDVLIAVDALAARSIRRLVTTIQLTDTGIHPGAGIGNKRYELTAKNTGHSGYSHRNADSDRCGNDCGGYDGISDGCPESE